jgi:hypothetical protein
MNQSSQSDWTPDPELLAAYFDGELEGRDDTAQLRARIEAWLESNPQASGQWAEHQQLKKLWAETTPAEPNAEAWARTRQRIDAAHQRPRSASSMRRWWRGASVVAASVLLLIGIAGVLRLYFTAPNPQPEHAENFDNGEFLEVALASEITILRIDTSDIEGVVVGEMPVSAPLDLAVGGEVRISCKCPRVVVRQDPPMVWAVASTD